MYTICMISFLAGNLEATYTIILPNRAAHQKKLITTTYNVVCILCITFFLSYKQKQTAK